MHDNGLGAPVDVGCYDGILIDGKPIHEGNCTDGVDGCGQCNGAVRRLMREGKELPGYPTTGHCDWCKKEVPYHEMHSVTDPEEGNSISYEVCTPCATNQSEALRKEYEACYEEYLDTCGDYDYYEED